MNDYGTPAEADAYAYGGATSFAEAERFSDAMDQQQEAANVMGTFDALMANIRMSPMLSPEEKASAMGALVGELQTRMSTAQGAKDVEPTTTDPGSVTVFKDNDNQWRWVAVHTNKYLDRTKEIFPEQAHRAYVEWVNSTKQFPALRLWHIPVDIGRADFVDYDTNGFVVSSGKFNPGMEDAAQRLAGMKGLGCSHGYLYRRGDLVDGVYSAYKSYEVTVLPVERSANTLTAFFADSEVPMLTAARKDFLVKVMGQDRADSIEHGVEQLAQIAGERGLSYKSLEEALLEGTRAVGDEKCPECGDMVAPDEMAAHMKDKHPDAKAANKDDTTATAEPTVDADGNPIVISTEGQEPEQTDEERAAAAAADAEPEAHEDATAATEEDRMPPADAETPSDADRAAAAQAMTDAGLTAAGDAAGAGAEGEGQKDDIMVALKAVFGEAVAPIMQRIAEQDTTIEGLKSIIDAQAEQIVVLSGDKAEEIANIIRPRVGPDARHAAATASTSTDNVVSDAEAARVLELSGAKETPATPISPYVEDLMQVMRGGIMGAPVATH